MTTVIGYDSKDNIGHELYMKQTIREHLARLENFSAVADDADSLCFVGHVAVTDRQLIAGHSHCMVRIDHIRRQSHRQPKATSGCVFEQQS